MAVGNVENSVLMFLVQDRKQKLLTDDMVVLYIKLLQLVAST